MRLPSTRLIRVTCVPVKNDRTDFDSRAKIKMLAKKSIETGEGCDSIPESMRHYLAMQFDPSKSGSRDPFGRTAGYGAPGMYANEANPSGKVGMYHKIQSGTAVAFSS